MDTLATVADVAAALGVGELTEAQAARAELLLAKVSRRFRLEAQRQFTPGTYTQLLKIHAGTIRLEEVPDEVTSVVVPDVDSPVWEVVGNTIVFDDDLSPTFVGKTAEVIYSWSTPVPRDVVAAVADIVARNLMLNPTSVVGQSTSLSTLDYRQDVADWASTGQVGMNDEDIAVARSYRYPVPPSIVLRP